MGTNFLGKIKILIFAHYILFSGACAACVIGRAGGGGEGKIQNREIFALQKISLCITGSAGGGGGVERKFQNDDHGPIQII